MEPFLQNLQLKSSVSDIVDADPYIAVIGSTLGTVTELNISQVLVRIIPCSVLSKAVLQFG